MNRDPIDTSTAHDAYAALRIPDYRFYLTGNLIANFGMRMQSVAVGWEIYKRTGSSLALGLVGLVQVLPVIALALPAGHIADRFSRKRIVMLSELIIALASLGLAVNAVWFGSTRAIYGFLLLTGTARAFQQPARHALLPQIVPRECFGNAVMWNTGGFNLASALGPAVGGLLIGFLGSPALVYLIDAAAAFTFFVMVLLIVGGAIIVSPSAVNLRMFLGGVDFVWRNKIILAAITLDLFAVLLGGAVALLPVFAEDILKVGPRGLGWMAAAPFLGALLMSFVLAHRPPLERAGSALLWSVVGFGLATIVFGLSRAFWLSLLMLAITGALDTISVVIRHTLVQLLTPDEMRGRVSAINGLFIGASNELGGFESGLVAALFSHGPGGREFGATVSVVSGGIGTILVVIAVAAMWPQLRRYKKLGVAAELPEEPKE